MRWDVLRDKVSIEPGRERCDDLKKMLRDDGSSQNPLPDRNHERRANAQ
jgi:hypothetical protein